MQRLRREQCIFALFGTNEGGKELDDGSKCLPVEYWFSGLCAQDVRRNTTLISSATQSTLACNVNVSGAKAFAFACFRIWYGV